MIYVSTDNPSLTVDLGDDLRVTVEVTRVGRPARLTGHPDRREPEEPPEWVVVSVEVACPNTGEWGATLVAEPGEVLLSMEINERIGEKVREELWQ